jgi:drug/metabolite transporter (DMT)-like permease
VTKRIRAHVGALDYLTCMTFFAALALVPIVLIAGAPLGSVHGAGWLWIALLSIVPGACGHGLMIWAHAHTAISVSSVLALMEPVLASLLAVVFLDESLAGPQLVGMALVVGALSVLALRSARAAPDVAGAEPVVT